MQLKAHKSQDESVSWYLIRWTYDADKSRSVQTKLGTVKDDDVRIMSCPEKHPVWKKLNENEQEELTHHWAVSRKPLLMQAHNRSIKMLVSRVPDARNAIQAGALSQAAGDQLHHLLTGILEDLRLFGFGASEADTPNDAANESIAEAA